MDHPTDVSSQNGSGRHLLDGCSSTRNRTPWETVNIWCILIHRGGYSSMPWRLLVRPKKKRISPPVTAMMCGNITDE
jgi:hypothetical protein